MASYAIGDLQGCYRTLQALLKKIQFDPTIDKLWFVGDLVNRGADSLACLRFVQGLGSAAITVLGNHDLHLLAVAAGIAKKKRGDTLDAILEASDSATLLEWLRLRPLLHSEQIDGCVYVLVHAGIWPTWTLSDAQGYAHEVESTLRSATYTQYLGAMYGAEPRTWHSKLAGNARLRFITNVFTRMRVLSTESDDLGLDTKFKGALSQMPEAHHPWFRVPSRRDIDITRGVTGLTVVAGHWSALGLHCESGFVGLDSGCLWGRELTAYRLDDGAVFQQANCEEAVVNEQE